MNDNIEKLYYTSREVCSIVNSRLSLNDNKIRPTSIWYYVDKGIVPKPITRSRSHGHPYKYTKDDIDRIVEITFLNVVLGVPIGKIELLKQYIKSQIEMNGRTNR